MQMGCLWNHGHAGVGKELLKIFYRFDARLVPVPAGEQNGLADFPEPRRQIKVLERSGDRKFAFAPHRIVNIRIEAGKSLLQRFGPGFQQADMPVVVGHHGRFVSLAEVARFFTFLNGFPNAFRQPGDIPALVGIPGRRRKIRRAEHHALYTGRPRVQQVGTGQRASPGKSHQVNVVKL